MSKENGRGPTLSYSQFLFNEPLCNEVLGIRNDFLQPGQNYSKCMEQNLDLTKSSL